MCRALEFAERTFYAAKARSPTSRSIADADHELVIEVEWKATIGVMGRRWSRQHTDDLHRPVVAGLCEQDRHRPVRPKIVGHTHPSKSDRQCESAGSRVEARLRPS